MRIHAPTEVVDMTADGRSDLICATDDTILVFPGLSTGDFGDVISSPFDITNRAWGNGATLDDLYGDGKHDMLWFGPGGPLD